MRKLITITLALILALFWSALAGHLGNSELTESCGSCHVGHGLEMQPMLAHAEEDLCYQCHGSSAQRSATVADGRLASWSDPGDIKAEFEKEYRHPVKEGSGHSPVEQLPSLNGSPSNHAECVDCHDPHRSQQDRLGVEKVPGYSLSAQYVKEVNHEYEICLKCHSDNESFGQDKTNIRRSIDLSAKSQHPVSRRSVSKQSVSLSSASMANSLMKCSDCHTNDDATGPRGPHGSRYPFLLSGNYDIEIYADESPFAYQFCYSCHDRNSILGNQSFGYHRQHIVGDPLTGREGTSCYTCHASHGSTNDDLINFNRSAVSATTLTKRLEYRSLGDGVGNCSLTCHGHEHIGEEY